MRLKHFESTQQWKEKIYDSDTPQNQILKPYDVLHCMRRNLSPSLKSSSLLHVQQKDACSLNRPPSFSDLLGCLTLILLATECVDICHFCREWTFQLCTWARIRGWTGDMCLPYFLKCRGRPVFCPPYIFGGRHFLYCTIAQHRLHLHILQFSFSTCYYTATYLLLDPVFVKFSQLIFRKIIKIVSTRCQIFRLKCTKLYFGWVWVPRPSS